jgi:hypothetical protein
MTWSGGAADGPPAEGGFGGSRAETDLENFVSGLGTEAVHKGLHGILGVREIFPVNEVSIGMSAGRFVEQGDEVGSLRQGKVGEDVSGELSEALVQQGTGRKQQEKRHG